MPRNRSTIPFLAAERIRSLALSALLGISIWQANSGTATAQPIVRQDFWVTDGPVQASALSGSTLYIGGSFGLVAPPAAAGGVPISSVNGAPLNGFPKVTSNPFTGTVYAVAPDGSGGWYIGGSFTSVGGVARRNIARILSDGSVSSWNPSASDTVRALAASGSRVYAGGVFASIGGQPRSRIAALDATTGLALTGWKRT